MPTHGNRMSQRTNVVTSHGGAEMFEVFQQIASQFFKVGVGFGLMLKDGNGPAELFGPHGFVIPVGPFNQPHPHRLSPLFGPFAHGLQIMFRISQVALNDDAHVADVAKFVFH